MPKPPVPSEIEALLAKPNPSVIGTLKPDGAPHTAATWYLFEDGRALVNMDESRRRLEYMRADPRVSLTVLDSESWYTAISLRGRAVSIEADPGLDVIDRISRHYTGEAYSVRDRGRVSAWIEVDIWHQWGT